MNQASINYRWSQATGWVAAIASLASILPAVFCLKGFTGPAYQLIVLIITFVAASAMELYWYKSYSPYFSFNKSRKTTGSINRLLQRSFALFLMLLLSAVPITLIDLYYAPVRNLFLFLSPCLFLGGVLYFVLLEHFGTIVSEDDDWLLLSQASLSTLMSPFLKDKVASSKNPKDALRLQNLFSSVLLRSFFAMLMLVYYLNNFGDLEKQAQSFWQLFNIQLGGASFVPFPVLYQLLLRLICTLDCILAFIGYLAATHIFATHLQSVDKNPVSWFFTLACYHPFCILELFGTQAFTYALPEVWFLQIPLAWYIGTLTLLLLMSVYLWSSIAFGMAFSNLSNRGIICSGPYRIVRHPAYACKIMTWYICAIPLCWQNNFAAALPCAAGLVLTSLIYWMRALTEERHLSADPNYQDYCRKVPWRFVPGLL